MQKKEKKKKKRLAYLFNVESLEVNGVIWS